MGLGASGRSVRQQWLLVAACVLGAAGLVYLNAITGLSAYFGHRGASLSVNSPQLAQDYLRRAIWLRPDLAEPRLELAQSLLAGGASTEEVRQIVEAALQHDGRSWLGWQMLGLLDFQDDKLAQARADFQRAERFNQGFAAHYQMANFAVLMGDRAEFWKELKAAVAVAPAMDVSAAISTAIRFAAGPDDPNLPVRSRGDDPQMGWTMSMAYLRSGFDRAAASVIENMHCGAGQVDLCDSAARYYVSRILPAAWSAQPADRSRLTRLAQTVWQVDASRRWGLPVPTADNLCVDSDLQHLRFPVNVGWVGLNQVGTSPTLDSPVGASGSLRVIFDGQEPQAVPLVVQFVPVHEYGTYAVSFASRGPGANGLGGVSLDVLAPGGKALAEVPAALSETWSANRQPFRVPKGVPIVALQFYYRRPSGEVRLKTPVLLSSVQLRRVQ